MCWRSLWRYEFLCLKRAGKDSLEFCLGRIWWGLGLMFASSVAALLLGSLGFLDILKAALIGAITLAGAWILTIIWYLIMAPSRIHSEQAREVVKRDQRIGDHEGRIAELEFKLTPKLNLACGHGVSGTRQRMNMRVAGAWGWDDRGDPLNATTLRIAVTTDSPLGISDCSGVITTIRRGDLTLMHGDNIELPISPSTAESRHIGNVRQGVVSYLDVLLIPDGDNCRFPKDAHVPDSARLKYLFDQFCEYMIEIVVSGFETAPTRALLKFNWTGNWETTDISMMALGQSQSATSGRGGTE